VGTNLLVSKGDFKIVAKAPGVSDVSIIDRATVLERVGGDEGLLRDIIDIFLEEYPSLVDAICTSVEKQDGKALERSAHNLKGSVSNFGARFAVQAAYDLELMGRRSEFIAARGAIETLTSELAALRSALAELSAN
jgi:HPt (histidine-containing phosphotransfer) domain-containing protein